MYIYLNAVFIRYGVCPFGLDIPYSRDSFRRHPPHTYNQPHSAQLYLSWESITKRPMVKPSEPTGSHSHVGETCSCGHTRGHLKLIRLSPSLRAPQKDAVGHAPQPFSHAHNPQCGCTSQSCERFNRDVQSFNGCPWSFLVFVLQKASFSLLSRPPR